MAWRTDSTGKVHTCYPYRIEYRKRRYFLYKLIMLPIGQSKKVLGKYEDLEEAKAAASADKEQMSLWGE